MEAGKVDTALLDQGGFSRDSRAEQSHSGRGPVGLPGLIGRMRPKEVRLRDSPEPRRDELDARRRLDSLQVRCSGRRCPMCTKSGRSSSDLISCRSMQHACSQTAIRWDAPIPRLAVI